MRNVFATLFGGAIIAVAMSAAMVAHGQTATPASGGFPASPHRALVIEKCTSCHVGAQVTSQRRTRAQWTETVNRMVDSYGAALTDEEYAIIVNYLATNFAPPSAGAASQGQRQAQRPQ